MKWALSLPLQAPEKGVLKTLAWHRHKDTGECFPSQETIAQEEGVTATTVKNSIHRLARLGLVTTVPGGRAPSGKRLGNTYELHVGKRVTATEAKSVHSLRARSNAPATLRTTEPAKAGIKRERPAATIPEPPPPEQPCCYEHAANQSNVFAEPEQSGDETGAIWCAKPEQPGCQERKKERKEQRLQAKTDESSDALAAPLPSLPSTSPPSFQTVKPRKMYSEMTEDEIAADFAAYQKQLDDLFGDFYINDS